MYYIDKTEVFIISIMKLKKEVDSVYMSTKTLKAEHGGRVKTCVRCALTKNMCDRYLTVQGHLNLDK